MSHVPQIMDDIFVCWLVQGDTFWWPASVLEVVDFDDVQNNTCGRGRLLYKKYRSYAPEEAEVTFCFTKRRGHYVAQLYEGSRLEMSWSTCVPQPPHEQATSNDTNTTVPDELPTDQQHGGDPTNRQRRKSARSSKSPHQSSPSTASIDASAPKDNNHPQLNSPIMSSIPDEETPGKSSSTPEDMAISTIQRNVGNLVEMTTRTFLDSVLEGSKQYLSFMGHSSFYEQLSVLVMHELRIDLVAELHRNFRTAHSQLLQGPSDLHQKCLRASVSCSLHTFSAIARSIHQSDHSDSVKFFPTYEQSQNPSVATDRLTVYFRDIESLSRALGFNDNRDFDTLYWREKSHENVLYTRVIGSLTTSRTSTRKASGDVSRDKKSDECSARSREASSSKHDAAVQKKIEENDEEDLIFVGLSMNACVDASCSNETKSHGDSCERKTVEGSTAHETEENDVQALKEGNGGISQPECNNSLVLKRSRALWDDESNMYLTHWEGHSNNITVNVPPSEYFSRRDKKLDGVFALRWEAKPIPRTAAWTLDAFRTDSHTLGKLEVLIPWVLVTGQQCLALGDILSKKSFKIRP